MSAVADTLGRFVLAIDDHDWDTVTAALAAGGESSRGEGRSWRPRGRRG